MQVRWLLISGLSAVTVGTLWLSRVPADATYVVDVLPAFLLVGIGFGLCGPALQIGALSGVAEAETGLASGLVETMREVGGAAGVAVVSAVLVAGSGLAGFHAAFAFIGVLAGLAVLVAAAGFARERRAPSRCQRAEERQLVDLPADLTSLQESTQRRSSHVPRTRHGRPRRPTHPAAPPQRGPGRARRRAPGTTAAAPRARW